MPRLRVGIETSCLAPLRRPECTPAAAGSCRAWLCAGTVDDVGAEIRSFVAAGLRHVVKWNAGRHATGGSPADLVRRARLIWTPEKLEARAA